MLGASASNPRDAPLLPRGIHPQTPTHSDSARPIQPTPHALGLDCPRCGFVPLQSRVGPGGAIRTLTPFFLYIFFYYGIHSLMFGGYPPTAIGYPPTAIGYTPTAIGYTPAAIGYPPTAIGYTPTAIGYPPAAIGYPPAAIVGRIGHSEFFFFFHYGTPWVGPLVRVCRFYVLTTTHILRKFAGVLDLCWTKWSVDPEYVSIVPLGMRLLRWRATPTGQVQS